MKIGNDIQNMMPLPGSNGLGSNLSDFENKTEGELKKAAKEFESMFMNIVLKEMRKTVPDSELLDGGKKVEFFESMLDDEYSKMMKDSPNSLSNVIYQNLNRLLGRADGDKGAQS